MAETAFERRFCAYAKQLGWHVSKYVDSSRTGAPDRILLKAPRRTAFAELKDEGKRPRTDQYQYIHWLHEQGFPVAWFDPTHDWQSWLEKLK